MPDTNVHPLPAPADGTADGNVETAAAPVAGRRGPAPVGLRGGVRLPTLGRPLGETGEIVRPDTDGDDPVVAPGRVGDRRARAAAYKQAGNAVHAPTARHAVALALAERPDGGDVEAEAAGGLQPALF